LSPSPAPSLERECALLCRQIFGIAPPEGCVEAYQKANERVFEAVPAEARAAAQIAEAVRRGWDLEAMELAQRLRDKAGPLTKKVNILFYLVEARPQSFPHFVNVQATPWRGWARLIGETLRSVYKLLKGWWLWRRLARLPFGGADAA
jgi:hypothetical protein